MGIQSPTGQECNTGSCSEPFCVPDRLYLDNAATSHPKPPQVFEAMRRYAESLGASAGRGVYREAVETGEILADCRRRLARLIGCRLPEQIVFTHNCSAALNLAIKGILRPGDHVVATMMEHNSVLRPLHALRERGEIDVTFVRADARSGLVDPVDLFAAVRPNTRLICLVHASNVTGTLQPIEVVAAEARRRGILFLVDAAQTAGHVPVDVGVTPIDLLAMPGHKGLLGPLGTGALYVRPGLEGELRPIIEGGTGSVSEMPTQPDFMPDKFESGSHNAIGLAGLGAALAWLESETIASLHTHDRELSERFLAATSEIEGLRLHGSRDAKQRVAVFSLSFEGLEPQELSAVLEAEFGLLTRSGIHCAPFAHEVLGTHASGGTTRMSFGAFNTLADADRCAASLARLASALNAR